MIEYFDFRRKAIFLARAQKSLSFIFFSPCFFLLGVTFFNSDFLLCCTGLLCRVLLIRAQFDNHQIFFLCLWHFLTPFFFLFHKPQMCHFFSWSPICSCPHYMTNISASTQRPRPFFIHASFFSPGHHWLPSTFYFWAAAAFPSSLSLFSCFAAPTDLFLSQTQQKWEGRNNFECQNFG